MGEGFLLDHTHGGYRDTQWVEGPPVKSLWLGHKIRGQRKLPVASYRCERCGLLENYAETR